jgi:hypothetical protein
MGLRIHNLPSGRLKKESGEVDEGVEGHATSFFASWASKKAIWTKSLKSYLNRRMALWTHNLPSGRLKRRLC